MQHFLEGKNLTPKIICQKNKGYKWYSTSSCKFKGYLQSQDNTVLRGKHVAELLSNVNSYEDFLHLLEQYSGEFSVILNKKNEIWFAVDIARSMPLYYTKDLMFVTDDIDAIVNSGNKANCELDDIRILEMYATSYVAFQNTVFQNIKQLELGCAAKIANDTITITPYFKHNVKVKEITEENAIKQLEQLTSNMIKKILNVVGKRQIVLSLSGGYDSRYLACSLKKNGVNEVICYTYGRSDSFEVAQSKKVADALGYKWFNIHYDDDTVKRILYNDNNYLDYCNRPDYSAYLQNYIAVKELHDKHLIPNESVFMTGLCNDMPTGFYIPDEEELRTKYDLTNKGVAVYNIANRFIRFKITKYAQKIFENDILDYLDRMKVSVVDYQTFVSALDCLETSLNHSRCFLNMNTVHEFFGYEWLLPCWDKELLLFWYSLPAILRRKQYLYEMYITKYLANYYGVGTKKHLNRLDSKTWKVYIKRKLGGLLVRFLYPLGVPLRRNTDINNFSVLEVELYKQIKQKESINAERAAITLMLTIYMLEYRYGQKWYKNIKGFLC